MNAQESEKEIYIRSEEMQEVLSQVPTWIVRWGITLIGLVLLAFVWIAFLVKYPDVVIAPLKLTTAELPILMAAKEKTRLLHLFAKEGDMVEKEAVLVIFANSANYEDIEALRQTFEPFKKAFLDKQTVLKGSFSKDMNLGEVQPAFAAFLNAYQEYSFFQNQPFSQEKFEQVAEQIGIFENLLDKLNTQQRNIDGQYLLAKKQYEIDEKLYQDKVIAYTEFNASEKRFLEEKYKKENIRIEILQNQLKLQELRRLRTDNEEGYKREELAKRENLRSTTLQLEAALAAWENRYLLRSPIAGRVSFFKPLAPNMPVQEGDELMAVLPQKEAVYGYAYLTSAGIGKVEKGQQVKIRFEGYPYEEYGSVRATVADKNPIAHQGQYLVRIELTNGLETSYKKKLTFSQDMQGEAHIITEDLRLIVRIFYQIRKIFDNTLSN
ncbi:HlyD family efflux transporter periplasmic adaptor subunit [Hugenholtzia roseola]|uniref:HlyD family efflux transporter periplasmic adaptor subunit n=1 Tax=Hugenholtzia roseola TaxID=1002 RepID=UPI00042647E2|nr:HlyD family efflux transporter periplasmic adaptor subunit [Hugenholtzia roseola]